MLFFYDKYQLLTLKDKKLFFQILDNYLLIVVSLNQCFGGNLWQETHMLFSPLPYRMFITQINRWTRIVKILNPRKYYQVFFVIEEASGKFPKFYQFNFDELLKYNF